MKFCFQNDTKRFISIHPATFTSGCTTDNSSIKHLDEREFILPDNTYPKVKLWDYGDERVFKY